MSLSTVSPVTCELINKYERGKRLLRVNFTLWYCAQHVTAMNTIYDTMYDLVGVNN